jgi:hypothetical protein
MGKQKHHPGTKKKLNRGEGPGYKSGRGIIASYEGARRGGGSKPGNFNSHNEGFAGLSDPRLVLGAHKPKNVKKTNSTTPNATAAQPSELRDPSFSRNFNASVGRPDQNLFQILKGELKDLLNELKKSPTSRLSVKQINALRQRVDKFLSDVFPAFRSNKFLMGTSAGLIWMCKSFFKDDSFRTKQIEFIKAALEAGDTSPFIYKKAIYAFLREGLTQDAFKIRGCTR